MSDHVARIKKDGTNFEVLIDPDKAMAFKKGEGSIEDAVLSEKIFFDAKKGELASENRLQSIFETSDPLQIAAIIIKDGEVQVSAEYREKLRSAKKQQIMNIIHTNALDPRTKAPHPMTRLENAFNEAKVKIDENKSAEAQIDDIVKQLQPIMPIRFETKKFQVIIPAKESSQGLKLLKQHGTIQSSSWQADSTLIATVEVPGGLYQDLIDKLNALTHGNIDIKEME